MSRRKKEQASKTERIEPSSKYKFFITNAFGKGKEHSVLQISCDGKTWKFLVLTHTPTGHYQLKRDPLTGKKNAQSSFLNTSIRTYPIATRLREDKSKTLSKEDEIFIDKLLNKKALRKGD